jgi:hypothetical protein
MALVDPSRSEAISSGGSDGRSVSWEYVKEQVAREMERKESLEKRALSVITTSGVLASLIFALAAFNIDQKTFDLPGDANVALSIGLVAFFGAAVLALVSNLPIPYEEVTPDALWRAIRSEPWQKSSQAVLQDTAETEVKVLRDARKKNGYKALVLWLAVLAEVVAIGAIGYAAWIIL